MFRFIHYMHKHNWVSKVVKDIYKWKQNGFHLNLSLTPYTIFCFLFCFVSLEDHSLLCSVVIPGLVLRNYFWHCLRNQLYNDTRNQICIGHIQGKGPTYYCYGILLVIFKKENMTTNTSSRHACVNSLSS